MKYKASNPYAPLRPAKAIELCAAVCPNWRMVTVRLDATCPSGPASYYERRADGSGAWHDGPAPALCGVVCDEHWRPVEITTGSGRKLPNLGAPAEEIAATP